MGAGGLASALIAGRCPSEGRERQMIAVAILIGAVAVALLPFANNPAVVAVSVTLLGLATRPFDIGPFTLRPRPTHPARLRPAVPASHSLHPPGHPARSALARPAR